MNSTVAGTVTGSAEENFKSLGELDTVQEQVLSIKTPNIERLSVEEQRILNDRISKKIEGPAGQVNEVKGVQYYDPLAQTFRVDETTGVFITCLLYTSDAADEV